MDKKDVNNNKDKIDMAGNKDEDQEFNHRVLIVDDEKDTGNAIARILKTLKLKPVYASDGEQAIEKVKHALVPFPIIIYHERMPGMSGTEFLEQSRKFSPDSVRFLVTGYSDMDAILDAVNKGTINRYISKPWDTEEFIDALKTAINQYEIILEHEHLLHLKKDQNTKLYKLNCELKDKAEGHKKTVDDLQREIDDLIAKIEIENKKAEQYHPLEKMGKLLKDRDMLDQEKINQLYRETIKKIFDQFKDIAEKNGFEMPETI